MPNRSHHKKPPVEKVDSRMLEHSLVGLSALHEVRLPDPPKAPYGPVRVLDKDGNLCRVVRLLNQR